MESRFSALLRKLISSTTVSQVPNDNCVKCKTCKAADILTVANTEVTGWLGKLYSEVCQREHELSVEGKFS